MGVLRGLILSLLIALPAFGQGLNRERGRYASTATDFIATHCSGDSLLVDLNPTSSNVYCGASNCSDGGSIDSVQTTGTDNPTFFSAVGGKPIWEEGHSNRFSSQPYIKFAEGDTLGGRLASTKTIPGASIYVAIVDTSGDTGTVRWLRQPAEGNFPYIHWDRDGSPGMRFFNGSNLGKTTASPPAGPHIVSVAAGGSNSRHCLDDGAVESCVDGGSGTNNWTGFTLGNASTGTSADFAGGIARLLVCVNDHPDATLSNIADQLGDTYGITTD